MKYVGALCVATLVHLLLRALGVEDMLTRVVIGALAVAAYLVLYDR